VFVVVTNRRRQQLQQRRQEVVMPLLPGWLFPAEISTPPSVVVGYRIRIRVLGISEGFALYLAPCSLLWAPPRSSGHLLVDFRCSAWAGLGWLVCVSDPRPKPVLFSDTPARAPIMTPTKCRFARDQRSEAEKDRRPERPWARSLLWVCGLQRVQTRAKC
jgi:hypothetical protein